MNDDPRPSPILAWLRQNRVINASGTMTFLGASIVAPETAAAVHESLGYFVDMAALQARASATIARLTHGEAGCVSACAASGIAVALAATMTGLEPSAAEDLPDGEDVTRRRVVIQRGHVVNYGASILQLIRQIGAVPVEIGTATHGEAYELAHALTPDTAAALYVVSHHTVQSEQIGLGDFVRTCHDAGVPVVVDAASEYDLRSFLELGADLVVYSAHKFLSGATAGIVAGRKELVRAAYMHQTVGLGRPMKVGKEGIVGAVAALERWEHLDHRALHRQEYRRVRALREGLSEVPGVTVEELADPTGNPITRLRVRIDPSRSGRSVAWLASRLREGSPSIVVRDHHVDLGFFELDPCNLLDDDVGVIVQRFGDVSPELLAVAPEPPGELGPRMSHYDDDGLPRVDLDRVPWAFSRVAYGGRAHGMETWPDAYLEAAVDGDDDA